MELPYVLECAVTAAPDEIRGQVVKASIVLTKGTVGTDELKKEIQNYEPCMGRNYGFRSLSFSRCNKYPY